MCGIRNDVVLGPGMKAAHRNHRWFERAGLAADQRLKTYHDGRAQYNRILGQLRVSAVPAYAVDADIDRIDIGQRITRHHANPPGGNIGGVVKGQRVIWLGKAGVEPVLDHRDRAHSDFFCRLANHHQRARPAGFVGRHQPRHFDPRGHMGIVAAGVHDPAFNPGKRCAAGLAGKGQPGLFDHRQRVHISADQYGRPRSIAQHCHHARLAYALGHGKAGFARRISQDLGRTVFLE